MFVQAKSDGVFEHECELFSRDRFGPVHIRAGERGADKVMVDLFEICRDEIRLVGDPFFPFGGCLRVLLGCHWSESLCDNFFYYLTSQSMSGNLYMQFQYVSCHKDVIEDVTTHVRMSYSVRFRVAELGLCRIRLALPCWSTEFTLTVILASRDTSA